MMSMKDNLSRKLEPQAPKKNALKNPVGFFKERLIESFLDYLLWCEKMKRVNSPPLYTA